MHIDESNEEITQYLVDQGHMLHHEQGEHSYPHCWRCHQPVIFRATNQWFVRIDHEGFRQKALEAVRGTNWYPQWGEQRMFSMVAERPDWCISRQRSWGVPIPAFYCKKCGEVLLTREVALKVAEVFEQRGADSWFYEDDVSVFLPEGTVCECGASDWEKESDILDVWFESGSSHNSVCRHRPELQWPADVYLEGVDQYRGWFQLSMLPSLAAWGRAPFKNVVVHGFVVDEMGKKMSKSLGNYIGVTDAVEDFRAEIVRLWCSSVDYHDQMSVNPQTMKKQTSDAYRRVRNTFRFLLGNTFDYDPAEHAVGYDDLKEVDRWVLDQLTRLVQQVEDAWQSYEMHSVFSLIYGFCTTTLSSTYLDVSKDRAYCSAPDWAERRSAQTAMHHVLLRLTRLVAPILVHTAEEVWEHIEHPDEDVPSVHLAHWPEPDAQWLDDELNERWETLLAVRDDVLRRVEALREEKQVKQAMEATVTLASIDEDLLQLMQEYEQQLADLLMVSELTILEGEPTDEMVAGQDARGLFVHAEPSEHPKCDRCWNLRPTVGQNPEHEDLCERCVEAVEAAGN